MNGKRNRNLFFLLCFFLLLLFFALTAFYPADSCFFAAIVPDSTENALSACHLIQYGKCGFFLNDVWHPSRYSFLLPATFFAPWVWLFAGEIMAGVYGCFFAVLLLLFSLAGIGKNLKSFPAVLLAFPFLLLLPQFILLANAAMTEIPYTALLALQLFLLVKTVSKKDISIPFLILFSLVCAWTGGIRSTGYFMLFPFALLIFLRIKEWGRRFLYWGLLAIPAFAVLAGTLYCNWRTFGSIGRSGYHYWCPVPYDFPSLCFQFSYIKKNLAVYLHPGFYVPFLLCLSSAFVYFSLMRKNSCEQGKKIFSLWKWSFFFTVFHYGILISLYSFHYWCFSRFFLPSSILALAVSSAALYRSISILSRRRRKRKIAIVFSLAAVSVGFLLNFLLEPLQVPVTYSEIEILKFCKKYLPEKSLLIITFNPALSTFYLGKEQTLIPFSRDSEYAGKVAALEKISAAPCFKEKTEFSATDHFAALQALPYKKVFLPFPLVVAESLPEKYRQNKNEWLLTPQMLTENKVYISNMALYQIPEKYRDRFMRETRLEKVAGEGPVELYRVHPVFSGRKF